MHEVIEQELGLTVEQAFDSFEAEPLASASIGQVHGAVLPGGDRVVVKVQRPGAARQIRKDVEGLSAWHAVVRMVVPVMSHIAERDLVFRAHLRLARTALALERYRLATGKLPPGLETLVPQYLDRTPIDPFDGQAIRYQPTAPGYILYSIGKDGQDNSGQEQNDNNRGAPYDLCFIVTR